MRKIGDARFPVGFICWGKFTFVGDTPDTLKGEPYKKYHEFTPFFAGPFAPKFN